MISDDRTYLTIFDNQINFYSNNQLFICDRNTQKLQETLPIDFNFKLNQSRDGFSKYTMEFPQLYQTVAITLNFNDNVQTYHFSNVYDELVEFSERGVQIVSKIPGFLKTDRVYNKVVSINNQLFVTNGDTVYQVVFSDNYQLAHTVSFKEVFQLQTTQLRIFQLADKMLIRDVQHGSFFTLDYNNKPQEAIELSQFAPDFNLVYSTNNYFLGYICNWSRKEKPSTFFIIYYENGKLVGKRGKQYQQYQYSIDRNGWTINLQETMEQNLQQFIEQVENELNHEHQLINQLNPLILLDETIQNLSALVSDYEYWQQLIQKQPTQLLPTSNYKLAVQICIKNQMNSNFEQLFNNGLVHSLTIEQILLLINNSFDLSKIAFKVQLQYNDQKQLVGQLANSQILDVIGQYFVLPKFIFTVDMARGTNVLAQYLNNKYSQTDLLFLMQFAINYQAKQYFPYLEKLISQHQKLGPCSIYQYAMTKNVDLLQYLQKFKNSRSVDGNSDLMIAVLLQNLELVKLHTNQAGLLNEQGQTALMLAIENNFVEIAIYLSEFEAEVRDNQNQTPLMLLCAQPEIDNQLLHILMKNAGAVSIDYKYASLIYAESQSNIHLNLFDNEIRLIFAKPNQIMNTVNLKANEPYFGVSLQYRLSSQQNDQDNSQNEETDYFQRSKQSMCSLNSLFTCNDSGVKKDIFNRTSQNYKEMGVEIQTQWFNDRDNYDDMPELISDAEIE
ncbi:Ankyrin_repeat protein 2 [Hexamita inflata]|uniref:Ankyrin repeat protein 2 n=1 Tax=Hexamita inflata TaxID=28002 RepID=A0AA86Q6D3_9EUKA|nr:Ankyrin repeat protein 2 [Hexamita inflata]CAI9950242.1 Ankyrin repeat protein 2 [Hexamita inflata]